MTGPAGVLDYWFAPATVERWYAADAEFDAELARRFLPPVEDALAGRLDHWAADPDGSLALAILLDQLPRNIWRGTPKAFSGDARARAIADGAVAKGFDLALPPLRRTFLYLPFEHSEDLADQRRAVALFSVRGLPDGLDWAQRHLAVIERFGRFPHRNKVLGRTSTPEEEQFLTEPGSSF